jgi:hypothetical protein
MFEAVVEAALRLFILGNRLFTLGALCGRESGLFDVTLLGGPENVTMLDGNTYPAFPLNVETAQARRNGLDRCGVLAAVPQRLSASHKRPQQCRM